MKLYFAKGTCSLAAHIMLQETGTPHDVMRVDTYAKRMGDGGDYLQVNPLGYVPALELDDGDVLVEGVAILTYLAGEQFKGRELIHFISRLTFIATELHKSYSALFNKKLPPEGQAIFRDKLHDRLAAFEKMLGDNAFVMPSGFSGADAYAYTVISWSKHVGVQVPPRVQQYLDAIHARPSTQAARKAESPQAA